MGDATLLSRASPVQIGTATWNSVSGGDFYTCGINSNGTLWCWGQNASGQLGDGSTTDQSAPIQIGFLNNWQTVDAGGSHTLALLNG